MKNRAFIMMGLLVVFSSEIRTAHVSQNSSDSALYAVCSFMGLSIAQDCYAKNSIKKMADLIPAAITACFVGASIAKPSKLRIFGALFCLGVYAKLLSSDSSHKNVLPNIICDTVVVSESELCSGSVESKIDRGFEDLDTQRICEALRESRKDFSDAAERDRATIKVAELFKSYLNDAYCVKPSVFKNLKIHAVEHLVESQKDMQQEEKKQPAFFKLYITQADSVNNEKNMRYICHLLDTFFMQLSISDSAYLLNYVDNFCVRDTSCIAVCIQAAPYVKPNTGRSFVEELD